MKKHFQYLSYVVRHKWFVLLAGLRTGAPLWRLIIHDWSKFLPCEWFPYVNYFYGQPQVGDVTYVSCIDGFGGRASVVDQRHDVNGSKYKVRMENDMDLIGGGQEFWAHDFEVDGIQELQEQFDKAWLHHQHANKHHWQHWVLREDSGKTIAMCMPEKFVCEMLADWIGAGRAITGDGSAKRTLAWYEANKDKMILHESTRGKVEKRLAMMVLEESPPTPEAV
jgi:hypothetical protein